MQVVLVMFRGEGERRSFSIVRDVTVIGRREDCDFRIPLGEISRKHCRLIKDGDTLRAEDLGSSNGTYVNGERVQEATLSPGDSLKVGSVVFVVQIDGVPQEDDLRPAAPPDSASEMSLSSPPPEHDLLHATAQSEFDHGSDLAAEAGDESIDGHQPTTDENGVAEHADSEHAGNGAATHDGHNGNEEYDPMTILETNPDDSSVGSMIDDDRIADDLIIELESRDGGHPNQQA